MIIKMFSFSNKLQQNCLRRKKQMLSKVLKKQKRGLIQYTLGLFLVFGLAILIVSSLLQYKINEVKKSELLKSEQNIVGVENTIIFNKINRISGDLLYVADCLRLNDNGTKDYKEVEKQWIAFSNRKTLYDQIRFIDVEGNEVIRINYSQNGALLVDKPDLQNKKERYYFTDTIKLKENEIYISKLDLNIENNSIEEPIKPMFRISMPYYDSKGVLKGIIILNYLANDLLNQIEKVASTSNGNEFLLNADGYWIYDSKNSENAWSFMYEDKADISFLNKYKTEWETIQSKDSGNLINKNGVFVFSKAITSKTFKQDNIGYSFVLGSGDLTLVSYMSSDSDNGKLFTQSFLLSELMIIKNSYYLYIFTLLISIIISVLVAINKNEKDEIKYFSEYDVMTGVYNRRAGFEKLSQLYKNIGRENGIISVCFIDINGLKEVNDALGHETGDELILSVIASLKNNIRNHDFVARLGGDEFLIIFEGLNESKSEEIWGRIIKEYNEVNETENRRYLISVSHGIEVFRCDSNQFIDEIVNNADEKMYNEKREIKKNLKVLRTTVK